MKNFFPGLLTIVALFISTTIFAQFTTGEYRSRATGDWNVPGPHGTWEQWDGTNWVTEVPGITSYVPGEVEIATSAPVIESTATYQGGNDNSHNVTLPSGIQAGDLLVMVFRSAESASTPSGWSLLSTRN